MRATAVTVHQECNEGDEDQEAGFAGAPFVQPAHDEEWMEYIDWGEVEAQAGGSSSGARSVCPSYMSFGHESLGSSIATCGRRQI